MQLEEDPLPTCTCMEEYIHHNVIHRAFETLVTSLKARFQEDEPHIFEACYGILHHYSTHEMGGREAFDRLTCILVNEADFLKRGHGGFCTLHERGGVVDAATGYSPHRWAYCPQDSRLLWPLRLMAFNLYE